MKKENVPAKPGGIEDYGCGGGPSHTQFSTFGIIKTLCSRLLRRRCEDCSFIPEEEEEMRPDGCLCLNIAQAGILGENGELPTCAGRRCVQYPVCCSERAKAFAELRRLTEEGET